MNLIDRSLSGIQFDAQVRDISNDGYGVIDYLDDLVFFVLGVFPGDFGTFEIISIKKKYGFAKLIDLKTRSPLREDNENCPHQGLSSGQCGGCPWIDIPYQQQINFKKKILKHQLLRHQLINEEYAIDIIPSPEIFKFRNRAQLKTNGVILGFVSRFSKNISPIQNCVVLNQQLQDKLKFLQSQLPNNNWIPNPNFPWSYIEIDDMQNASEYSLNKRRPFKQANTLQNVNMKIWLRSIISKWDTSKTVIELFCGSGNFTEVISEFGFQKVIATDVGENTIAELHNKFLRNTTVIDVNIYKPSDWKFIKSQSNFCDFLILDPPRKGFEKLALFASQLDYPNEIIYISCNIESFLNDVTRLRKKGYKLKQIMGVDQFPHTTHLEVLSHFTRD